MTTRIIPDAELSKLNNIAKSFILEISTTAIECVIFIDIYRRNL